MDLTSSVRTADQPQRTTRVGLRRAVLGLQTRFTIMVVGLALLVGATVGTITFDFSTRLMRRLHADQCRQTAQLLARQAATDFPAGASSLARLAADVVDSDMLMFVSFMEPSGNGIVMKHGGHLTGSAAPTVGFTPNTTIGQPRYMPPRAGNPAHLDVTFPVRANRDQLADGAAATLLLGYVRIGLSLERTLGEVNATIEFLTGIAVLISALTVPLGFVVVRRIVGPLRDLAHTIGRFAAGELGARSPLRRSDELGDLASAYNAMANRLEQKHLEISQLNTQLEERVQERTRQLRELAIRDGLTGLYNRRHFSEVLERSFAEARRYGGELACMMIDLDNFKTVNDRFGHQCGDEVLMQVAGLIRDELRTSDVAARYGGDEFVVLLPHTDVARAHTLAARIQEALTRTLIDRVHGCEVTLSVGVASTSDAAIATADDLVRLADGALYAAKDRGKNTVVVHEIVT